MIDQLLLSKKLYQEGCRQHEFGDPISDGMSVSLFQDAIEIYVWTLIKEQAITVGKNSDFTNNLGLVAKAGLRVPSQPKLLELNKARVNFKHYGNLPAHRDVAKFKVYALEFLIESCLEHFGVSFTDLSSVDLLHSYELQQYFKSARVSASTGQLATAYENLGKAKYVVFRDLSSHLPRFASKNGEYAKDFETVRELLLVAIYKIDITEFAFASAALPTTVRTVSGVFHQNHHCSKYSLSEFNRIFDFLVELCARESL